MEQPLQLSAGNGKSVAHTRYRIEDRSYLNVIKKEVAREAQALGFSAERIGRLDIILNELATNLLKFGIRKRELLWKPFHDGNETGIELLALDGGPGISNTGMAMQDGYSTSGTHGEGLGAIKRLSDTFELYSQPGLGTIALSRLYARELPEDFDQSFPVAAISVPKQGETLCGDGYTLDYDPAHEHFRLLVVDGLGHGPEAHLAAEEAIAQFNKAPKKGPLGTVIKQMHEAIKKTRGVVGMALQYDFKKQSIQFCGVGNIGGRFVGLEGSRALSSFNGIIGHVISSSLHAQEMPWDKGKLLILYTDGIISRWDLSKYPQLLKYDPAIIAACLYRDFNRSTDDVTVVVCKIPQADARKGA